MRKIALFFYVCMLLGCDDSSSPQNNVQQLTETALQSNRAWDILESLTTEIGPRLAGTEADQQAVAWAEQILKESGFDKVWLEPVEFPVWRRQREFARIIAPYPQDLKITALGYSGSTDGEMFAQVVKFESLKELQATSINLHRKFVFLNQHMERDKTGDSYEDTVAIRREGPRIAKEKGAMGVLIRSVGTDNNRLPHTWFTSPVTDPLPAAALSAPDADQLVRILKRTDTVTVSVDIQTSIQPRGQSYNVVAQLNGNEKPEDVLLMGAHLDSWDLGTGALDNGAGVAIVTAAAQLIAELPNRPARSIRVVLFANKEQNLWGARAYADTHRFEMDNHIVAAESDLGAGAVWRFDTDNRQLLTELQPILDRLKIAPGTAAMNGGPDLTPIAQLGVPVMRLQQDASNYFDYHHTANDTLDKVDPKALKQNVAAWAAVYYTVANSDYSFRKQ